MRQGKGRRFYMLERWVRGRHYHLSTGASTLRAAMQALQAFELDPVAFSQQHRQPQADEQVTLTVELIDGYAAHQRQRKRSARHIHYQRGYLIWWAQQLHGRDMRSLRLSDYRRALDRAKALQQRIAAIKSLCSYLRTELGVLRPDQDATLQLKVPQSQPAQRGRSKAVPLENVAAVLPHLPSHAADTIRALAGTGLHYSELSRWCKAPSTGFHKFPFILSVKHKSGRLHHIEVADRYTVAALKRLHKARAPYSYSWLRKALLEACKAAGVPVWAPGQLRHSVATWAYRAGASLDAVTRFMGWQDSRTGLRFYVANTPARLPELPALPF